MPYNNYNINQLYRQKDNIENMIASMLNQQAPVQNIINTSNSEIDVKFLNKDDNINNIIITKKTLFINEAQAKIVIKEVDGTISKTYDIIVPKDEKDLKIEELEKKLKDLEGKINGESEYEKSVSAVNVVEPTSTSATKPTKSATVTTF